MRCLGRGRAWAQRLKWNRLRRGPGGQSFSHCSEPSLHPRAASGHRNANLLPKKILLNAHITFILGCKLRPASEDNNARVNVGVLLPPAPSTAGETDGRVDSASPGPPSIPYTLLVGVRQGGEAALSLMGLRGLPGMDGWIWNLCRKHLRVLEVPMCLDITQLPCHLSGQRPCRA